MPKRMDSGMPEKGVIEQYEEQLLDLLYETLDFLHFCRGGADVEGTIAKVEHALRTAGRKVPRYDSYGNRRGTE
jgi:hypothetical protein